MNKCSILIIPLSCQEIESVLIPLVPRNRKVLTSASPACSCAEDERGEVQSGKGVCFSRSRLCIGTSSFLSTLISIDSWTDAIHLTIGNAPKPRNETEITQAPELYFRTGHSTADKRTEVFSLESYLSLGTRYLQFNGNCQLSTFLIIQWKLPTFTTFRIIDL